jgi:hypothetical protein
MRLYRYAGGRVEWKCLACQRARLRCRCGVNDWIVNRRGARRCRRCDQSAPRWIAGTAVSKLASNVAPAPTTIGSSTPVPPVDRRARRRPTTPCPTCLGCEWTRHGPHGQWFCNACRRRKLRARALERVARDAHAKEAALLAKRATLPRWLQPIYRGDEQDLLIWQFFTLERLRIRAQAEGTVVARRYLGLELGQRAGLLHSITERDRMNALFQAYALLLKRGEDVGDDLHPPWWEPGKSPFTRR